MKPTLRNTNTNNKNRPTYPAPWETSIDEYDNFERMHYPRGAIFVSMLKYLIDVDGDTDTRYIKLSGSKLDNALRSEVKVPGQYSEVSVNINQQTETVADIAAGIRQPFNQAEAESVKEPLSTIADGLVRQSSLPEPTVDEICIVRPTPDGVTSLRGYEEATKTALHYTKRGIQSRSANKKWGVSNLADTKEIARSGLEDNGYLDADNAEEQKQYNTRTHSLLTLVGIQLCDGRTHHDIRHETNGEKVLREIVVGTHETTFWRDAALPKDMSNLQVRKPEPRYKLYGLDGYISG